MRKGKPDSSSSNNKDTGDPLPRRGQWQDWLIRLTVLLVLPPQVQDGTWTPRPGSKGRRGGESYLLVLPFVPEKHSIVPRTNSEGWDRPVTQPQGAWAWNTWYF